MKTNTAKGTRQKRNKHMVHNVFRPASRATDGIEEFRRRWKRTASATNFTEAQA